ncbi:MAG TPA: hypothetical protein ENK82_00290 [Campylobacterales bacterium]|nr:hypothetical protein [Campylobacterales bacterium]HHS91760.1 hypothetical protein [Campylobacterales bacterium]
MILKFFMILAPGIAIALMFIMSKRGDSLKKIVTSFLILWYIVTLALLGMVMLSLKLLFILHMTAVLMAYLALLYYILRHRLLLMPLLAPTITMLYYLILVWGGNQHLPNFFS